MTATSRSHTQGPPWLASSVEATLPPAGPQPSTMHGGDSGPWDPCPGRDLLPCGVSSGAPLRAVSQWHLQRVFPIGGKEIATTGCQEKLQVGVTLKMRVRSKPQTARVTCGICSWVRAGKWSHPLATWASAFPPRSRSPAPVVRVPVRLRFSQASGYGGRQFPWFSLLLSPAGPGGTEVGVAAPWLRGCPAGAQAAEVGTEDRVQTLAFPGITRNAMKPSSQAKGRQEFTSSGPWHITHPWSFLAVGLDGAFFL